MAPAEYYDDDLAYIHDAGFGDFARNAAAFVQRVLAAQGTAGGRIVELGCGSGITTRALVEAGFEIVGIDISASTIEIARRHVPEATFHVGSYVDFPIPPCQCVTAIGEVFNYLFDTGNSLTTLRRVCENIFKVLTPHGVLIFDVAGPERCRNLQKSFDEGRDWACLVELMRDEAAQQLSRRIVTFRQVGDVYRRHEEIHRQQLYEPAMIVDVLETLGYQVETLTSYGHSEFPAGLAGFIARKTVPDERPE